MASLFTTLLTLLFSLLLFISNTTGARNGPEEYWKDVMKELHMPHTLRGLIPLNDKPNILDHGRYSQPNDKKPYTKDFKPHPSSVLNHGNSQQNEGKPFVTHPNHFTRKFMPQPNAIIYNVDELKDEKPFLQSFPLEEEDDEVKDGHKEVNILRLQSMDGDAKPNQDGHRNEIYADQAHARSSHHMDHQDLSFKVFFMEKDLKLGKKMPFYFPDTVRDPSHTPHLLSREEAELIPFSSSKLSYLLELFSISKGSPQAEAVENTLRECESKPIKGETKTCATSLESMLDFARGIFGMGSSFNVLTTIIDRPPSQAAVLQNYTMVKKPKEISAPKMVACHPVSYPYAIFYCHQTSESKVYRISLRGEFGEKVEAVAVCHMDTSGWSPNHGSFHELGIKPGTETVCHIFLEGHLVWVPSPTRS